MNAKLERVLREIKYEFVVAFSASGRELFRCGEPSRLAWRGLPASLVGNSEAVSRLAASVPSRTFQIFAQGGLRAVVFKLSHDLILVLFDQLEIDAAESYRQAKWTMEELLRE
jgi:hypothetical protein